MKQSKNTLNPIVKLMAALLCTLVFIVGFWHTHLGLKEMKPFNSEYGSIIIASIILLLLLISYIIAIEGRKIALVFYFICGLFFFTFNLNYFYPAYVGRQLVKEEAIALNDTLQSYSNRIDLIDNSGTISSVSKLYKLKKQILDEISGQAGFGPRATDYLNQFNLITNGNLKPNRVVGHTDEERLIIANRYSELLNEEIKSYVITQITTGKANNADKLYTGIQELDSTNILYSPKLKIIIADNSKIELDSVKTHPQIILMQSLITSLDNATIKINEASRKNIFPKLEETKTRNLGRFAHTFFSVRERIDKLDTWGIILVCLFIDFLVPLAVYLLIRKKDEEQEQIFSIGKQRNFNKYN